MSGVGMEFEHNGVRFSIVHLPGIHRLQVWMFPVNAKPEVLHGKDIPEGMKPAEAANIMCRFITGELTLDEYSRLLPEGQ